MEPDISVIKNNIFQNPPISRVTKSPFLSAFEFGNCAEEILLIPYNQTK